MKETLSPKKALEGLLEKGKWFQCQGVPEVYEGQEVDEKLREPEGHALFHINEEGKIDLISMATRESLGKPGKAPVYQLVPQLLSRVKKDLTDPQSRKRCPICQHLLKIHREGGSFSKQL